MAPGCQRKLTLIALVVCYLATRWGGACRDMDLICYNPCSVRTSGRLEDITREFQFATAILLAGTRVPAYDLPLRVQRVDGRTYFHFGYSRGKLTNRSTGCAIAISEHIESRVVETWLPPPLTWQGEEALFE